MRENQPMLTVVIPVFNVERYIEECLQSVESQTYQDYEVVLVDDGSTDNSPRICDEHAEKDPRIHVLHIPNQGVSNARNTGIEAARGKYLYFLDADDLLADSRTLEKLMKFAEDPSVDFIAGKNDHFYHGSTPQNSSQSSSRSETSEKAIRQFIADKLMTCNVYARSLIGEDRFDTRITLGEDVLFLAKIVSKVKKAVLFDHLCYHRRLRPESAFHSAYKSSYSEEHKLFRQLIYKELHGRPGGDELLEKYEVDVTGLINQLAVNHQNHPDAVRMVRARIAKWFPHFWLNPLMTCGTKLFVTAFIVSPKLFYLLFGIYKRIKHAFIIRKLKTL